VEKSELIDGSKVSIGDSLIGLASSGPHSNGYSLIRKVLEVTQTDPATVQLDGEPLIDLLMKPTRIYVKPLLELIKKSQVNALAHITGGGLLENIPRVLPDNTKAVIDATAWKRPAVFDWLQQGGNIDEHEMHRTLNCGVGMVICVPAERTQEALAMLKASGENAFELGVISALEEGEEQVQLVGLG
jgi:phosphoribosylformylglycinamidine cyclo-ligase